MVTIKELQNDVKQGKFCTLVESVGVSSSEQGTLVRGLALPLEKVSRNGFAYITESIKSAYKTMEGTPVLFNHNPDIVLGHVTKVEMHDDGLHYEMDLDSDEPIIKKMKRGDVNKVSIQVLYDEKKSFTDENEVVNAYIKEFLELSVVTIPGFSDTTAMVIESLNSKHNTNTGDNMSKNEISNTRSETKKSREQEVEPTNGDEPKKVPAEEPEQESVDEPDKIDKVLTLLQNMAGKIERLSEILDKPEDQEDDKETEEVDEEPEKDDEKPAEEENEDDEEKREEAIRKDRKTVVGESTRQGKAYISQRDFRTAFADALKNN